LNLADKKKQDIRIKTQENKNIGFYPDSDVGFNLAAKKTKAFMLRMQLKALLTKLN